MSEQTLYQIVQVVSKMKKRVSYQQSVKKTAFHEERENIKKIVKQDGDKHLKKVENIPFTDSEHDDWLQNRVYYFATRSSKSEGLIYVIMFL